MKNQKIKGNLLLLLTAFVWGTSFIAQSKGVEIIPPAAFIGVRSIIGGIVLLPVIFVIDYVKKKRGEEVYKWDKSLLIGGFACGVFLCVASTLQTAGMVYTSPGKAGFITALYMIIIPIIGIFMGKRPSKAVLIAVVIAVIGMYLMCINGDISINKGDVIIFACAFVFAGHILTVDHFSPKVDGAKLACMQFFVCGILAFVYSMLFEHPQIAPVWDARLSLLYSGVMSCSVAYTLQIVGQKYTDPTSASILMSLESVFSTLSTVVLVACGWHLTGGAMTAREIWGCVFMFAAILLVQLPEKQTDL